MRRYSSSRITEGSRVNLRAEWIECADSSSAEATPFSTRTRARRAAQMLIGSKLAFSTSTGLCKRSLGISDCSPRVDLLWTQIPNLHAPVDARDRQQGHPHGSGAL